MQKESCHFFEGARSNLREHKVYPWVLLPALAQSETVLCHVNSVKFDFDSREAAGLLLEYFKGEDGNDVKTVVEIELEVVKLIVD